MKEILICKWPIESYRPEGVGESSKTRSSTKAVNHYAVNGTYCTFQTRQHMECFTLTPKNLYLSVRVRDSIDNDESDRTGRATNALECMI